MLEEGTFIIFKTTAQVTIKSVFCSRYVLYNAIVKKCTLIIFEILTKLRLKRFPYKSLALYITSIALSTFLFICVFLIYCILDQNR